jgi:hypothetical protein
MSGYVPPSYFGPVEYAPQQDSSPDRAEAEAALHRIPGVEGVGEGRDQIGDLAWIAYLRDRSVAARLPARIAGRAVVPLVSGEITILPAR